MKLYRLLSLAIALTTLSGCNKPQMIKVIILSGQSNMEGHEAPWQDLDKETINKYKSGHDNVKINYDCTYNVRNKEGPANTSNNEFVPVDFGQGRDQTLMGPEVGLAKYLGEQDPNQQYYLIKIAEGSSTLYEDWQKDGRCYVNFEKDLCTSIYKLTKLNINFTISGFVWMQGEDDAKEEKHANDYERNMLTLIDNINTEFKDYIFSNGMSVIDGGITTDGVWAFSEVVNNAKKKIAASNPMYRYVKDSETLEKISSWHYTQKSYLKLGEKFAEAYLDANK